MRERGRESKAAKTESMRLYATIVLLFAAATSEGAGPTARSATVRPFVVAEANEAVDSTSLRLSVRAEAFADLNSGDVDRVIELPLDRTRTVRLHMQRFSVTRADSRFEVGGVEGRTESPAPDVVLFRGSVEGELNSHAYLAMTSSGVANGYVTLASGERHFVSTSAADAGLQRVGGGTSGDAHVVRVHRNVPTAGVSDMVTPCGVTTAHDRRIRLPESNGAISGAANGGRGPRVLFVAVDSDFAFYQLFGDETAAQAYIVQVIGAVSDIYLRDFDVRLVLTFSRVWPAGGEPINAADLSGFANYWEANEPSWLYHLVHLFSGRRNLSYGGVAYVAGSCSGFAYGISGFLLGSFPTPIGDPNLGTWDVVVVAHEMGHNMGTFHTHDGYSPPIDQCGSTGAWARSEIMSYCHIVPGGLLNTEMRFSKRIQDVVRGDLEANNCQMFDCNDNGVDDALDILNATSADVNFNGVPDECEDCNSNGVVDSVDIALGAADVNGNGVPDICEPDCNGNGRPDPYDISHFGFADENGNLIPDVCEADCNGNEFADFVEIRNAAGANDLDRDGVIDLCQDCNANGTTDWIDRLRPGNIFIGDLNDYIREYHAASGVGVATRGAGAVVDPYDVAFGPDRMLYVASRGNHNIVRIDPDTGASSVFVAGGGAGIQRPGALLFLPNGNLLAASNTLNNVIEYDGATGAFVRIMVAAGSGGLSTPHGMTLGPNGNLFVAGGNRVNEYDVVTGGLVRNFVSPGAGGLSDARGLVFLSDGRLLVVNRPTGAILAYDSNGASLGQFNNDGYALGQPWGIRIGPNGNVFVTRTSGSEGRVIEFNVTTGRYIRSFIRGDSQLVNPTGFAYRSASPADCDDNGVLDACELEPESPLDCNGNGIVDSCETAAGMSPDCNANAIPDSCDIASGAESDVNANGVPDSCESECIVASPAAAEPGGVPKNRYLSFDPSAIGGVEAAIRVRLADLPPPFDGHEGSYRWVGPPADLPDDQIPGGPTFKGAALQCSPHYRNWSDIPLLAVYDTSIVPGGTYEIQVLRTACNPGSEADYSTALTVHTVPRWGDVAPPYSPPSPAVQPDFSDIAAMVDKFKSLPGALPMSHCDLHPAMPDQRIDFSDIGLAVDAFVGLSYPYPGPVPCP